MANVNFASKEVSCKIVYYGPGRSGKTTNLEWIHGNAPGDSVGDMLSIATEQDRTLYFDFLSLDLGKVAGMTTKFQVYTVPGQIFYNATRKIVLEGADGVVFVADSHPDMMAENLESLENLWDNLRANGLDPDTMPLVFQWNKRDLDEAIPVEELEQSLNTAGQRSFESVAIEGKGVFPTLKSIAQLVIRKLNKEPLEDQLDSGEISPVGSPPAVGMPEPLPSAEGPGDAAGLDPLPDSSPFEPEPQPESEPAAEEEPEPVAASATPERAPEPPRAPVSPIPARPTPRPPSPEDQEVLRREEELAASLERSEPMPAAPVAPSPAVAPEAPAAHVPDRRSTRRITMAGKPKKKGMAGRVMAGLAGGLLLIGLQVGFFSEGFRAAWAQVHESLSGSASLILASAIGIAAVLAGLMLVSVIAALQDGRSRMRVFQVSLAWCAIVVLGLTVFRSYSEQQPLPDNNPVAAGLRLSEALVMPVREQLVTQGRQYAAEVERELSTKFQEVVEMTEEGKEAKIIDLRRLLREKTDELDARENELRAANDDLARLRQELAQAATGLENLRIQSGDQISALSARVKELEGQTKDLRDQLEQKRMLSESLYEQIKKLQKQLAQRPRF